MPPPFPVCSRGGGGGYFTMKLVGVLGPRRNVPYSCRSYEQLLIYYKMVVNGRDEPSRQGVKPSHALAWRTWGPACCWLEWTVLSIPGFDTRHWGHDFESTGPRVDGCPNIQGQREIVLKARTTGETLALKEGVKKAEHTCIGWWLKSPRGGVGSRIL